MAIIKAGSLVADIRGKVGTNVFSRNQGGAIVRDVGTWVQPDNENQVAIRAAIEALSKAWSSTLSEAQRGTWKAYAVSNPRPNRWGTNSLVNGYSTFLRHNFHSYVDQEALQFASAPTSNPIHPPSVTMKVQQNGALEVTGTLTPNVTGTYIPIGMYGVHPCWKLDSGNWWIWFNVSSGWWWITSELGTLTTYRWYRNGYVNGAFTASGSSNGLATSTWTYESSLARITTPPSNYASPPTGLTLYLYSGIPLNAGRSYYSGPWLHLETLAPAIAAVVATTWRCWTWPTRSVEPPWTWPADGSGSARFYAIAQDAITGSISTKHISTPTFGSLTPW